MRGKPTTGRRRIQILDDLANDGDFDALKRAAKDRETEYQKPAVQQKTNWWQWTHVNDGNKKLSPIIKNKIFRLHRLLGRQGHLQIHHQQHHPCHHHHLCHHSWRWYNHRHHRCLSCCCQTFGCRRRSFPMMATYSAVCSTIASGAPCRRRFSNPAACTDLNTPQHQFVIIIIIIIEWTDEGGAMSVSAGTPCKNRNEERKRRASSACDNK